MDNPIDGLQQALDRTRPDLRRVEAWGGRLARVLADGGRLLACGNGGSAAEAQHLTAELVGRFEGERRPLSAIALHAETSSLTAIENDYGPDEMFARQVRAHGRQGDVFIGLSTSGASRNVVAGAKAARELGLITWALTGPGPSPLSLACDDTVAVESSRTATIQEVHLMLIHTLCASIDTFFTRSRSPQFP